MYWCTPYFISSLYWWVLHSFVFSIESSVWRIPYLFFFFLFLAYYLLLVAKSFISLLKNIHIVIFVIVTHLYNLRINFPITFEWQVFECVKYRILGCKSFVFRPVKAYFQLLILCLMLILLLILCVLLYFLWDLTVKFFP